MKRIALLIGFFAMIGVVGLWTPALAGTYVNMSGAECVVENPSNNTSTAYYGRGLDFTARANTTNWVHCQIQTQDSTLVRLIRLQFYTESSLGRIKALHVYNGRTRVKLLDLDLTTTGGWSERVIDLGDYINLSRGLNLSFNTSTGSANTRYIFGNVAYFAY